MSCFAAAKISFLYNFVKTKINHIMKSQSILFKSLGVGLLAILCILLYNRSDMIFDAVNVSSSANLLSLSLHIFCMLPSLLLLVFFWFLWNDNKDSQFAKYAFWTAAIAISAIVATNLLGYAIDQKWESINRITAGYSYDQDSDFLENKYESIALLSNIRAYISAATMLLVVAFFFAVDVLRRNKKLLWAAVFVVIAWLSQRYYTVQYAHYANQPHAEYFENFIIFQMITDVLQAGSVAYLFFVYAQKDQPLDEDKKFTNAEWLAVAGALVTMIFFFCNWMDCEKIFGKDSGQYVTLGCHVVPFAAMGLAVIAGTVISVFMRSNVAKQISCIGMMAWPLVVCIATWIFDVHDGYTVGEIIQEANEEDGFFKDFMKMIHPISIIGYTVCSIGTGILILKTLPKKVKDEFVPNPPVLSKDDEIARLRAEIAALREKAQDPQN